MFLASTKPKLCFIDPSLQGSAVCLVWPLCPVGVSKFELPVESNGNDMLQLTIFSVATRILATDTSSRWCSECVHFNKGMSVICKKEKEKQCWQQTWSGQKRLQGWSGVIQVLRWKVTWLWLADIHEPTLLYWFLGGVTPSLLPPLPPLLSLVRRALVELNIVVGAAAARSHDAGMLSFIYS